MEEKRIGVYVCWCGTNIASMVDVEKVSKEILDLPNVVISKDYKYMCSDPGQDLIVQDIKEHNLNRVVVAACSPRMHEITFRKALENAGLNPYMFEMANIREHDSWVHTDRDEATRKAKDLIAASIARVQWHESLERRTVEVNPATLIIGGGISGISAALEIANADKQVFLVEKSGALGGHVANVDLTFPYLNSAKQMIDHKIVSVMNHPKISVYLNTQIKEVFGYVGNFETTIEPDGKETKLNFGSVIVATGLKLFDAGKMTNYGYGKLNNVVTSMDFEKMLKSGKILTAEGKVPNSIAIIHCVGSRNEEQHVYCSRTCCMTALKYANQIRSAIPASHIYDIYSDMRAFGKGCEELYTSTSKKSVMFLSFDQKHNLPQIKQASAKDGCNLLVDFKEKISGESIEVPADMVILMVGMEAQEDAKTIGHAVGVSMCGNSFYIERHPKLDPVATTTDGVYVVGACQAPKDIPDSISQAKAAVARILATIQAGSVSIEVTTAVVNEDICCGCQTCIKVCPYTAISFDPEKKVSVVNEILCKGCGTCGSTCPTGAIKSKHFTDLQILSQIEGLMLFQEV
ncbi:MAG: CoB--CoM heterodisulfide reductase iron-sulfur subunit A family protein [Bacteroidetes bacterium]|nr:CoB--CoM heterodisulfide reductase iron-sulfur subunit A family protein [Bacteroidota bacterium]